MPCSSSRSKRYEKTSLREIAERLGVTKAALYYYFKSKEDIVRSLVEDYVAELDDLIAWAKTRPRSPETRAEIITRYLDIVANGSAVFRMLHQNQAAVSSLAAAKERGELFRERMDALVDLLSDGPGAPLRDQIRAASCLMSLSYCAMHYQDRGASPAETEGGHCSGQRGIRACQRDPGPGLGPDLLERPASVGAAQRRRCTGPDPRLRLEKSPPLRPSAPLAAARTRGAHAVRQRTGRGR